MCTLTCRRARSHPPSPPDTLRAADVGASQGRPRSRSDGVGPSVYLSPLAAAPGAEAHGEPHHIGIAETVMRRALNERLAEAAAAAPARASLDDAARERIEARAAAL